MFKGYTTATWSQLTGTWKPSTYKEFPILKSFAEADCDAYSQDDGLDATEVLVVDDPTYTNERGHAFTNAEAYNVAMQLFVEFVNLYDNDIRVQLDIPQAAYEFPETIEDLDKPIPEWRLDDMVKPVDFVVSLSQTSQTLW